MSPSLKYGCLPKWKRERRIETSLLSFKKWLLLNEDHHLFIWQEAAYNLDRLLCFLSTVFMRKK